MKSMGDFVSKIQNYISLPNCIISCCEFTLFAKGFLCLDIFFYFVKEVIFSL